LSYNNPFFFNIAVTYITRPGKYYTPVINSSYNKLVDFYEPVFSNDINSWQYEDYNNLSISLSRYFQFMKKSMIVFVSINNILNSKNQSDVFYNFDYSNYYSDYYQQSTFYFGAVWQMNY